MEPDKIKDKVENDDIIIKQGEDIYNIDKDELPEEIQEKLIERATIQKWTEQTKKELEVKNVDIEKCINLWLQGKSENTQKAYKRAIKEFIEWAEITGLKSTLLAKAEDADEYINTLKGKYKANTVRLKANAVSSFFRTMRRYGNVDKNPFEGAPLPKREYKKAVKTDQEKTIPVMNEEEYKEIIKGIQDKINRTGDHLADIRARESAKRLLPAVKFMGNYGLRVGALPTVERKGDYFTFTTKGNKVQKMNIREYFPDKKRPFKAYSVSTIKGAVKRLSKKLKKENRIRHAYSCHDFRHYFATQEYCRDKDIVKLKNLLGHASINVTDQYLQEVGIKER